MKPAIACQFHELTEPLSAWLLTREKHAIEVDGMDEKEAHAAMVAAYGKHVEMLLMLIQIGIIKIDGD